MTEWGRRISGSNIGSVATMALLLAPGQTPNVSKLGSEPAWQTAIRQWRLVESAIHQQRSGTLDYYFFIDHVSDGKGAHVRAQWRDRSLILEILAPTRFRAAFQMNERRAIDWSPGKADSYSIHPTSKGNPYSLFTPPISLGTVLSVVWDPLSPRFGLPGKPFQMLDAGNVWLFLFPVPRGYEGPGFRCAVSKLSHLPVSLSRQGGGVPTLHVSYVIRSLAGTPVTMSLPLKLVRKTAPSFSMAFERSRFMRLLERALYNRP